MTRTALLAVAAVFCLPLLSGAAPQGKRAKITADDTTGYGAASKQGLRSSIALAADKDQFFPGQEIRVTYQIANFSNETRVVMHAGFWPNNRILVHDAQGKLAPETHRGKLTREAFGRSGRDKNFPVKVAPGRVDVQPTYNLCELYDLSKPGRYRVQYIYDEGDPVHSNLIDFEVIARGN